MIHKLIHRTFKIIHTTPNVARKGGRKELAVMMGQLGFKEGAEIGVWKGEFSEVLCQSMVGLHLFCVDPWTVVRVGGRQRHADYRYAEAQQRLSPYNITFKRALSMDAVREIPDGSLDFVYIDAGHDFDNCMLDIICWSQKVRIGGIVAGHDYFIHPGVNVVQAADAYAHAHGMKMYVTREEAECQTFFWVKEHE